MRHRRLLASVALTGPALAQVSTPPARSAAEIVVVAPTPLTDVGEGEARVPPQTASDEQIQAAHAVDLTDYLKRITGGIFVNEVQDNPLQPDISYRGFTASPLLGTPQGLSVYLDGVRLNQPFGDVVSWDLIPKAAIRSVTLVPGSNPLFGRNSLGGALSIRTKDGASDPGYLLEGSYGSFRRRTGEAQAGGVFGQGFNWFVAGNYFAERGWRDFSPSEAGQAFAKLGWKDDRTDVALSGSYADTKLNGNGLQEMRLLEADRSSVYTQPDQTRNRSYLANLTAKHSFSNTLRFSGNAFWRRIATRTFNGDINDDSLGESLYQPNATERAALTAAGYTGFPTSGETQANTPFPRSRCIANALLNSEPNEKCNGLANRSATRQREWGGTGELTWTAPFGGGSNVLTVGASYVGSRARFRQSSEFAYLTPERGVVGVGRFADGTQDSENAFDARVDLDGRTQVGSLYALDALDLTHTLHLDLSGRYDATRVRNRDGITPGGGVGSLDGTHHFNRFNPAVALRWSPAQRLTLDAAIAQTSRAPSAIELGCSDPESPCRLPNALAGDPPLKQVVARTGEAGLAFEGGPVRVRVGAFRTVSRDDILFVTDDAAGFGYFRNFGRTRRQGIDLDLSAQVGRVTLTGHYGFLDATYRTAETVDGSANSSNDAPAPGFEGDIAIRRGDRIPLIPRHIGKVGVTWAADTRLQLTADMIAIGGMFARGNENNADRPDGIYYLGSGRTVAYAVANVGAEWQAQRHLALFVQCDNLFDKTYASAAQLSATGFDPSGNFVARPFAGPVVDGKRPLVSSTFYSPGAPRSVRVGARLRF